MVQFVTKPPITAFSSESGSIQAGADGFFDVDDGAPIIGAIEAAGYEIIKRTDAPAPGSDAPDETPEAIKALNAELRQRLDAETQARQLAEVRLEIAETQVQALRKVIAERQAADAMGPPSGTAETGATPPSEDKAEQAAGTPAVAPEDKAAGGKRQGRAT